MSDEAKENLPDIKPPVKEIKPKPSDNLLAPQTQRHPQAVPAGVPVIPIANLLPFIECPYTKKPMVMPVASKNGTYERDALPKEFKNFIPNQLASNIIQCIYENQCAYREDELIRIEHYIAFAKYADAMRLLEPLAQFNPLANLLLVVINEKFLLKEELKLKNDTPYKLKAEKDIVILRDKSMYNKQRVKWYVFIYDLEMRGLFKKELLINNSFALAQAFLGQYYEFGFGLRLKKDVKEAVRLYGLAAAQKCPRAINNLSICYKEGIGLAQDVEEAKRLQALNLTILPPEVKASSADGSSIPTRKLKKFIKCPVSYLVMSDPVVASSGITYQRENLIKLLDHEDRRCPITRKQLTDDKDKLIVNKFLKKIIHIIYASDCTYQKETLRQAEHVFRQARYADAAQLLEPLTKLNPLANILLVIINEKPIQDGLVPKINQDMADCKSKAKNDLAVLYYYKDDQLRWYLYLYETTMYDRFRINRLENNSFYLAQSELAERYFQGRGVQQNQKEATRLFRLAAEKGCSVAQVNLGLMYQQGKGVEKDLKEAVRLYRLAVAQDYFVAHCNLGRCLYDGIGVEKDLEEATKSFLKAFKQGYVPGAIALASCYLKGEGVEKNLDFAAHLYYMGSQYKSDMVRYNLSKGQVEIAKDREEAYQLCCEAAHLRHAPALFDLGLRYQEGNDVKTDLKKAVQLYRSAIDRGEPKAIINLGCCYKEGLGVEKDAKEAARLFRLASDHGSARAQYALGVCYEHGEGVEKDEKEAIRLYRLASVQQYPPAQCALGECYKVGRGVEQNYQIAVIFYRLAAEQGHAYSQLALGFCYDYGNGVEKDTKEAVRLYRLASDQGYSQAQYYLGICYAYERAGLERNMKEAVQLVSLAAEKGFAPAQIELSKYYLLGDGVEKDEKEAVRLLRLAAAGGDADALTILEQLGKSLEEDKKEEKDTKSSSGALPSAAPYSPRFIGAPPLATPATTQPPEIIPPQNTNDQSTSASAPSPPAPGSTP